MFLNMTQKRLQNEKVCLLPATLPLPRILGPRSKLPQVAFVVCCLVFCLQTEVAIPTPKESSFVQCPRALFSKGPGLSAQDSSRGSSNTMWISQSGICLYLFWRNMLELQGFSCCVATLLRASPFSGLTCSSYFLM